MPLPTAPPISVQDILTEFGAPAGTGLAGMVAGGTYVPAGTQGVNGPIPSAPPISVTNFYGAPLVLDYNPITDSPDWVSVPDASAPDFRLEGGSIIANEITIDNVWLYYVPPVHTGYLSFTVDSMPDTFEYDGFDIGGIKQAAYNYGIFLETGAGKITLMNRWGGSSYYLSNATGVAAGSTILLEFVLPDIIIWTLNGVEQVNESISPFDVDYNQTGMNLQIEDWPSAPDTPILSNWTIGLY